MSSDKLTKLKTGSTTRNFALARMGIGAGLRAVSHGASNLIRAPEQRQQANKAFLVAETQRFVTHLGELKGSVMKVGQMLSLYGQYFLPPEAVAILRSLQDDSAHVDWQALAPQLRSSLGEARLNQLDIDTRPLAAASLGQVHQCRIRGDGRPLCLKIRYPGVAQAIDSDMRSIARLLMLSHLVPEQISPQPMLAEIREMLHREVDYPHEAQMTRLFSSKLEKDPRFVVPQLEDAFCTDDLLLMSFEEGLSLNDPSIKQLSQQRRNDLGEAFFDLFCTEFFCWNLVQTDPHYGNYRLRLSPNNDRIVLLDFGATRRYSPTFVKAYAQILSGGLNRDFGQVMSGCADAGVGVAASTVPERVKTEFYRMICLIVEPFCGDCDDVRRDMFTASGAYQWARGDVFVNAGRLAAKSAAGATTHFSMPPREIVFLHRRLAGVYMLLGHLGCELNLRESLEDFLRHTQTAV